MDVPAREHADVVIVGAGIAGASLAYFLAERGLGEVVLLEREPQLAVHSTGRSAATLAQLDPIPTLLALKVASAPFFQSPPAGFSEHALLRRTGVLNLLSASAWETRAAFQDRLRASGLACELLSVAEAGPIVPVLEERQFAGALLVPGDGRLDVHEILASYLRHARARGADVRLGTEVTGFAIEDGRCRGVRTQDGEIRARLVVDAAGAWAGRVAALAGASPIRLTPLRRTIFTFPVPAGVDAAGWPLVASDPHTLYFAPEAGDLMMSPMDEVPIEPCDPHPDDETIAAGVERLAALAPALRPQTIKRRWSGLRTFAPDRVHVVGEDPVLPGFFWLAGQGGCGIETSPTIGAIAADLVIDGRTDRFDARLLAPDRFA
ncbi:MAG TPA: FAD-binding oxidoreductase [Candidatus Binatia bacterium]|nr:FAD-binding oxidoreductase [Candidatus Binatia bacterium]